MAFVSRLLMKEFVTHDVKRFVFGKPAGFSFTPGQATNLAIQIPGWEGKKREFTFTSLPDDLVLEFTIKGYPEHKGVTNQLHQLPAGSEVTLEQPWGTIQYKGTGVFLAGGAGITPFIAIFRDLRGQGKLAGNTLIFANKEARDVLLEKELRDMFGGEGARFLSVLSREEAVGHIHGHVDEDLLKREITDFTQHFYVCGPPPFTEGLKGALTKLGAPVESLVFEM